MAKLKYTIDEVLCLSDKPKYSGAVREYYRRWRIINALPERCDNEDCRFHSKPLSWNGQRLPLILDHRSGNRNNNTPGNLRFLCPNCDSQNWETRAGANKGRIVRHPGGAYERRNRNGTQDATLPGATLSVKATLVPGKLVATPGASEEG